MSSPDHQIPLTDTVSHDNFRVSMTKVDCERGAREQGFPSKSSQLITLRHGFLRLACLLGLVLLVSRYWPLSGLLHRCGSGNGVDLSDVCPQVEPLVPSGYEGLLASLDEEFDSSEFRLKAYESLGGAVRIP